MAKHLQSEGEQPGPYAKRAAGVGSASLHPPISAPRYIRLQRPANDNPAPLHLRLKWFGGIAVLLVAALILAWLS